MRAFMPSAIPLQQRPWTTWPEGLRKRDPAVCDATAATLAPQISDLRFRQFVFDCQWRELRDYATERGLLLFGDIPIYVHLESADVWGTSQCLTWTIRVFPTPSPGYRRIISLPRGGCGQPQYNWALMRETGFRWWLQRFDSAAKQFDIARIDHFRALQAYWEIPANAVTAKEGTGSRPRGVNCCRRCALTTPS